MESEGDSQLVLEPEFNSGFVCFFFFWPHRAACGIPVPRPGMIEPGPLQWESGLFTTGPPGKSLNPGVLTAKTLPLPPMTHSLIHSKKLFLTRAHMPAVVQGTGGTEINKMDMVLVLVSSHSGGKTDPSLTR